MLALHWHLYLLILDCANAVIEPKILLPFFGNYQVNYTVDAQEGCYQWKSLREEVATITPSMKSYNEADKCSQSATIVVTSTQSIRKTTLMLATNVKTGTVFQSDVIVDKIHLIDIISRTRELYLADPPEELKIRALDQEGNTFSSTAGMIFDWSLAQDEGQKKVGKDGEHLHPPVSAHSILHIQKFLDTIYVPDAYVDVLERKGKTSDTILISGIQTGAAVVVARLVSSEESHKLVKPSSVRFVVRDKVMLNPSHDVYLLRHSIIRYKVERWREGIPTEIKMPSSQYVLNVRDITIGKGSVINLDRETSTVIGLNCGHSQVYLIDQHLKHYDRSLMEQAMSDVYVVEPAYLRFDIVPHHKWILEVERLYEISVQVFSQDNKLITLDENVRLEVSISNENLEVLDSVNNGSWFFVRAIKKGSCDITAHLRGVISGGKKVVQAGFFGGGEGVLDKFANPIFISQHLEIFDKIVVDPDHVLFPWVREPVTYQYSFKAYGGSGNYTWSLNETEPSSVSYTGEVTTKCGLGEKYGPRSINVKATDIRHSYHFGSSSLKLVQPVKLEFALSRVEAATGTTLNLLVGMYGKVDGKLVPFTDCSQLKTMHWSIHDTSIFEFFGNSQSILNQDFKPLPNSPFCLMRKIRALREGHTTVSISYNTIEQDLQASTVIAAYRPLRIKDPLKLAVVALGSAKTMVFDGGPNPWPLVPNSHQKTILQDKDLAEFTSKISGKEHVYVALCKKLGESEINFSVGNRPCGTNPFPQMETIIVRLSCTVPTSMKLTTDYLLPHCPISQSQNVHTVVLAGDIIQLSVTAYDKFGNQFDNFTSLFYQWTLDSASSVRQTKVTSNFHPDTDQQTKHSCTHDLLVPNTIGGTNLQLLCDKYQQFVPKTFCDTHDCKIFPGVEAFIYLDIVGPVMLDPQHVVMFNRPNYSSSVLIDGGSGHFSHDIKSESPSITALAASDESYRTIIVSPISSGHTTLIVSDLCIRKATEVIDARPQSTIIVSDLASLVLKVTNLLEVGSSDKVSILLDMKEISPPNSFDIHIKLSAEPEGIVAIDQAVKGDDLIFYANINAIKVGSATVKASTTSRDGELISSNNAKVTVFPPLILKPPRITVIRGSEFYLYVTGGPPEDVQTYFVVEDPSIASASLGDMLIAHELGNTTVRVRAATKDGQVFHGKSSTLVHVIQLTGVLIDIPTHKFYTGAHVPVNVYGYGGPGYDPVYLDSAAAGLVFAWNVNNHAVLEMKSVHFRSGIEVDNILKFTMIVYGKNAGRGSISVSVSASKQELNQLLKPKLDAEIQISVFEPLFVVSEDDKKWGSRNNLLLTPDTSFHVVSNRDDIAAKVDHLALCESCKLNITSKDESCIVVNDEAKSITTSHSPCQGTLLVTAFERFGSRQSLAIHVNVKMVSYLMTESYEKFYHRDPEMTLSGFPMGSKIEMKVTQHDSYGQKFDLARPNAKLRANRNDLLEVIVNPTMTSMMIDAAKSGITVFRVWSDKNTMYHFPMPVVSTINDEEKHFVIPIGVKKCFRSDAVDADRKSGKWSVNRPFSVIVDSGGVMAITRTSAELSYTLEAVQAKLSISSKPFSVKLDKVGNFHEISNVEESYIIPIRIMDDSHDSCQGLETEMNNFAEETFNCSGFLVNTLEPVKVFEIRSAYLDMLNSYACIVERIDLPPRAVEKISTFDDASFTLTLSINSKFTSRGISIQSPINLRFLPAFKVLNDSLVIMDGSGVLCLSATLEIHASIEVLADSKNLEIDSPGSYEHGVVCRKLSLNAEEPAARYNVKFFSTLTKQEEWVVVGFKCAKLIKQLSPIPGLVPSDPIPENDPWVAYQYYSYSFYTMIIATVLIIVATSLFFCGSSRWSNTSTQFQAPASPGFHIPPQRRSPPNMMPYSPNSSLLFSRSSPTQQRQAGSPSSQSGGSPSPRRPQLWSSYYQPQGAGT